MSNNCFFVYVLTLVSLRSCGHVTNCLHFTFVVHLQPMPVASLWAQPSVQQPQPLLPPQAPPHLSDLEAVSSVRNLLEDSLSTHLHQVILLHRFKKKKTVVNTIINSWVASFLPLVLCCSLLGAVAPTTGLTLGMFVFWYISEVT